MLEFRLPFFIGTYFIFLILEQIFCDRRFPLSNWKRVFSNLSLVGIYNIFLMLLYPVGLIGIVKTAGSLQLGFFNTLELPNWVEMILILLLFDFLLFFQHVLFHRVHVFWQFHKVHHSDHFLDTSSAMRFHPIEMFISFLFKSFFVFIIGPSVEQFIVFEIILSSMAIFNHSNLKIPAGIDRILSLFFVTPSLHKVHHSVKSDMMNSNFGFNLIVWDRVFCTFTHSIFIKELGVEGLDSRKHGIRDLMKMPFR